MSDDDDVPTGACLVALPAAADATQGLVAQDAGPAHITLLWFGEAAELQDVEQIRQHVEQVVLTRGEFVAKVNGRAVLGDDDAGVLLVESVELCELRDDLFDDPFVRAAYLAADQFPAWIPHLTLTYGGGLPKGDLPKSVAIDRVGLWLGGQHEEFSLRRSASPSDDPNFRTDYDDETISASVIPPVLTIDDLPLCLQFAGENPGARWYAERCARSFGRDDLIPVSWSPPGPLFIVDAVP